LSLSFYFSLSLFSFLFFLSYKELKGMKFPAPYYMALAMSVDVGYFLSMAEGGYGSQVGGDWLLRYWFIGFWDIGFDICF